MVVTKIKNPTKERQHYGWVPKHGLWLDAGQSITIAGSIEAKRKRNRTQMANDMVSGRAMVVVEVDAEFGKNDGSAAKKVAPVPVAPVPPVEKASDSKKTVILGDATIEEIPVVGSPDIELNIPGIEVVEDGEEETVFDERGNELPKEEVVVVENIHDIDGDDVLANTKPIEVVGDVEPKEEVTVPSKTAMRKLNKPKVLEIADSLDISYKEDETKSKIIEKILAAK